jgi:hypothetical protein
MVIVPGFLFSGPALQGWSLPVFRFRIRSCTRTFGLPKALLSNGAQIARIFNPPLSAAGSRKSGIVTIVAAFQYRHKRTGGLAQLLKQ